MPSLNYGQIEPLIVGMLGVEKTRASAINARFNTIRKLGFPEGVNVGKKARFKYDLDATLSTLVVFALLDALVLPLQAVTLVQKAWPGVKPTVRKTLRNLEFEEGKLSRPSSRPADAPYLTLRPNALAQLRDPSNFDAEARGHDYRPHEPGELKVLFANEIASVLDETPGERLKPGMLLIDLYGIVSWTADAIVRAGWATPSALGAKTKQRATLLP